MTEEESGALSVFQTQEIIQERKKKLAEREEAASKQRLKNDIQKKMKTTMIGALASFEETFGHLWGHNKSVSSLTKDEKHMRELWDITRTEILDKGNNQVRMALSEISQYSLKWNKYHVDLTIKKFEEPKNERN
jgi:hypothetical protein